jgi:uncharacterized metal-binding protein
MYPKARREPCVRRYSLSLYLLSTLYSLSLSLSLSTLSLSLSLSLLSPTLSKWGYLGYVCVNPFTERSEARSGD